MTTVNASALLDASGEIVAVNEAWRHFSDANGSRLPGYGIGSNYVGMLQRLAESPAGSACGEGMIGKSQLPSLWAFPAFWMAVPRASRWSTPVMPRGRNAGFSSL